MKEQEVVRRMIELGAKIKAGKIKRSDAELFLAQCRAEASTLRPVSEIEALRPALAKAAQKVYDEWEVDEDGEDPEVGSGGICHLIASAMAEVLHAFDDVYEVSSSHEVHVYLVAATQDGVYLIDVPYDLYETGGGYNWQKIAGVEILPSDVVIQKLDSDPGSIGIYADAD